MPASCESLAGTISMAIIGVVTVAQAISHSRTQHGTITTSKASSTAAASSFRTEQACPFFYDAQTCSVTLVADGQLAYFVFVCQLRAHMQPQACATIAPHQSRTDTL